MQLMFFAGHFACSVVCVLGGRVSVQKCLIIDILHAIGSGLCEPRAPSVMVLCLQYGKGRFCG